jgi:hypothetical protein
MRLGQFKLNGICFEIKHLLKQLVGLSFDQNQIKFCVMNESEDPTKQIDELKKQLQASNDKTKVYLQNVAHQLTAPLGAIKWSIDSTIARRFNAGMSARRHESRRDG